MRLVLLLAVLATLVGVVPARAQPVSATTVSGEEVVLFKDGTWISADAITTFLRDGRRVESETGRFAVYVPEGWSVEPATQEMFGGEFNVRAESDSTVISPVFLDDVTDVLTLLSMLQELRMEVGPEGPGADSQTTVTPVLLSCIGDQRVMTIRVDFGGDGWLAVSGIVGPHGTLLVFGFGGEEPGRYDDMIRRIEVAEADSAPESPTVGCKALP